LIPAIERRSVFFEATRPSFHGGIRSEFNEALFPPPPTRGSDPEEYTPGTRNPGVKGPGEASRRNGERSRRETHTCDSESGVSARDGSGLILRDAPIHPAVLLLLAVHDPQEEEGSRGQQDPVRLGVARRRLHKLAVLVPLDHRFGLTLRLAVQRHRLIFRDYYVRRVLGYPRTFQLSWKQKAKRERS